MIIVVKGPSNIKKTQFAVELSKLLNGRYMSFNDWNNIADNFSNYKTAGILVLDEEYPKYQKIPADFSILVLSDKNDEIPSGVDYTWLISSMNVYSHAVDLAKEIKKRM